MCFFCQSTTSGTTWYTSEFAVVQSSRLSANFKKLYALVICKECCVRYLGCLPTVCCKCFVTSTRRRRQSFHHGEYAFRNSIVCIVKLIRLPYNVRSWCFCASDCSCYYFCVLCFNRCAKKKMLLCSAFTMGSSLTIVSPNSVAAFARAGVCCACAYQLTELKKINSNQSPNAMMHLLSSEDNVVRSLCCT